MSMNFRSDLGMATSRRSQDAERVLGEAQDVSGAKLVYVYHASARGILPFSPANDGRF